MNKRLAAAAMIVLGGTVLNPASAELFTDPTAKNHMGKSQITGLFGTSTVTYDLSGGYDHLDVDRTFLGASWAYGMSDKLDIYGTFALITDAELENYPSDDSGTALALGMRGTLPINAQVKIQGYAQLLFIDEDYAHVKGATVSGKDTTLSLGAVAIKKVDNITLYGGPELVLFSDGTVREGSVSVDTERDDIIGLRAGATFDAGELDINFGLSLMHENGFTLGVSKAF